MSLDQELIDFAGRWRLDGDYLRCEHCKRPHLASWAAKPFEHRAGCPNAGPEQYPWYELQVLLTRLPDHLPKPRHAE